MNPIVFEIPIPHGGIAIHAYGLALGLGVLAGWYLFVTPAHRVSRRVRARAFGAACAAGFVAAWAMARGLHAPSALEGWAGIIVGALVGAVVLRRSGASLVACADAAAIALLGALTLAALGGWLGGVPFGLPWESAPHSLARLGTYVRVEDVTPPALTYQIDAGWLAADAGRSMPTHPVALYTWLVTFSALVVALRWSSWAVVALSFTAFSEVPLAAFRADPGAGAAQLFAAAFAVGLLFPLLAERPDEPGSPA